MTGAPTIFVAGHAGMVGSAIMRHLRVVAPDASLKTISRSDLDLTNQAAVDEYFREQKPDQVYLAAARVGGIVANDSYPADFIRDNLNIQTNVIDAAYRHGVQRLLFLGSSCIYPRLAAQPIREDALLTGPLEPTNEAYAVAKIAGIKMCEAYNRQHGTDFRSVMPTNLYGEHDNFHPENSHVIPALIRRFHEAVEAGTRSLEVWGTGRPMREFLHVDDMAAASVHVMNLDRPTYDAHTQPRLSHINIGTGEDVSIADLARLIARVTRFDGEIHFDSSRPDGTPRKLLNVGRLHSLGWRHAIDLEEGLRRTYLWYVDHLANTRTQ